MNRRDFLGATTAAFVHVSSNADAQTPSSSTAPPELRAAAREAWIWGLPLIEFAQQRSARGAAGMKVNALRHQRTLVTAKEQFVTTPSFRSSRRRMPRTSWTSGQGLSSW